MNKYTYVMHAVIEKSFVASCEGEATEKMQEYLKDIPFDFEIEVWDSWELEKPELN